MDDIRICDAVDLPEEFYIALERWRLDADRIIHSDRIQWYAKSVSTLFELRGKMYRIYPRDLFSPQFVEMYNKNYMDNVLAAGMEILQGTIERDLKAMGADYVQSFGFLD